MVSLDNCVEGEWRDESKGNEDAVQRSCLNNQIIYVIYCHMGQKRKNMFVKRKMTNSVLDML